MSDFPKAGHDPTEVYDWLRAHPPGAGLLDVLLDEVDWARASFYINAHSVVPATEDRPALFWFEGRRFLVRRP